MKTLATINLVIFLLVFGLAVSIGINPKKWQTWLLSLYGFITFFLIGVAGTGNIYKSIESGAIGVAIIFGGIITYWNRERAKKWLRDQEKQEEESYGNLK